MVVQQTNMFPEMLPKRNFLKSNMNMKTNQPQPPLKGAASGPSEVASWVSGGDRWEQELLPNNEWNTLKLRT